MRAYRADKAVVLQEEGLPYWEAVMPQEEEGLPYWEAVMAQEEEGLPYWEA